MLKNKRKLRATIKEQLNDEDCGNVFVFGNGSWKYSPWWDDDPREFFLKIDIQNFICIGGISKMFRDIDDKFRWYSPKKRRSLNQDWFFFTH